MGSFISIEGPDGVGKTTIIKELKKIYPDALFIREPGTTPVGEKIREMLLIDHQKLETPSELLLFTTSFAETSAKVIRPAIKEGQLVIADRWFYSTVAYQVHANDKMYLLDILNNLIYFANIERPSLNIILMAPWEVLKERLINREGGKDKIEERSEEYRHRVYEYYDYYCEGTIILTNRRIEIVVKRVCEALSLLQKE